MSLIQANENNFDELVMESNKPVLVNFFANWCSPCQMLGSVLENMASN